MTEQTEEPGRYDDKDLNEAPKNEKDAADKAGHEASKDHRAGEYDDKDQ